MGGCPTALEPTKQSLGSANIPILDQQLQFRMPSKYSNIQQQERWSLTIQQQDGAALKVHGSATPATELHGSATPAMKVHGSPTPAMRVHDSTRKRRLTSVQFGLA